MEIVKWVAWHDLSCLFVPLVLVLLFLFLRMNDYVKMPKISLGKGWSTCDENSHAEWYVDNENGSAYWKVIFD